MARRFCRYAMLKSQACSGGRFSSWPITLKQSSSSNSQLGLVRPGERTNPMAERTTRYARGGPSVLACCRDGRIHRRLAAGFRESALVDGRGRWIDTTTTTAGVLARRQSDQRREAPMSSAMGRAAGLRSQRDDSWPARRTLVVMIEDQTLRAAADLGRDAVAGTAGGSIFRRVSAAVKPGAVQVGGVTMAACRRPEPRIARPLIYPARGDHLTLQVSRIVLTVICRKPAAGHAFLSAGLTTTGCGVSATAA